MTLFDDARCGLGRRAMAWVLACGALGGALVPACRARESRGTAGPGGNPPDVLLVTVDTMRADRVSRELTPAIDTLTTRGVWFSSARTVAPLTLPAHVSLFTGRTPPKHGVRLNGSTALESATPSLATLLSGAGYATAACVGAYVLDRRFGLSRGFDLYDDLVPRAASASARLEAERKGAAVVDRALSWLAEAARAGRPRPLFLWVHLYDPHAPYEPPAAYLERARGQAYDGEVAYADAQIARLIGWFQQAGRLERTVVVVAGDHGESLGEHGERTHGMLLYDPALRVPLVFAGPGIVAGVRNESVSLIDVAPTVLRLAGLRPPSAMEGQDLLAPDRDVTPHLAYSETLYPRVAGWSTLSSVTDGTWKLIKGSELELYDLGLDPAERQDLSGQRPGLRRGLESRLDALGSGPAEAITGRVPADVASRLRALGYVTASSAVADATRPNPARHIGGWARFEEAQAGLAGGRAAGAVPLLQRLVRDYPDAPVFSTALARALDESGRSSEALLMYRRAASRWPDSADVFHDMALAAERAGLVNEAIRAEQAAIALDPTHALALNGLGLVLGAVGRAAEAGRAFDRAAAADPTNAQYLVHAGNAARQLGDLSGARRRYEDALKLAPRSADALNGIGAVLVQTGRAAEAVPLFRSALREAPDMVEAQLNLGIALQETGDHAGAREAYLKVLGARDSPSERQAASQLLRTLPPAR